LWHNVYLWLHLCLFPLLKQCYRGVILTVFPPVNPRHPLSWLLPPSAWGFRQILPTYFIFQASFFPTLRPNKWLLSGSPLSLSGELSLCGAFQVKVKYLSFDFKPLHTPNLTYTRTFHSFINLFYIWDRQTYLGHGELGEPCNIWRHLGRKKDGELA
jgi:hypothetical protein